MTYLTKRTPFCPAAADGMSLLASSAMLFACSSNFSISFFDSFSEVKKSPNDILNHQNFLNVNVNSNYLKEHEKLEVEI